MNEPDRFQQGEILSASRLNDVLDYSRGQYASIPETGSNIFGGNNANASANKSQNYTILLRAAEDFRIQKTDCAIADDVPSGLSEFVRIVPILNQFNVPPNQRAFYVHDPVAGLSGSATKSEGDYFHAVFNNDTGRWEVLSASEPPLVYAIVRCCLDEGWHEVEITDWYEEPAQTVCGASDSASVSVSVSVSDAGDECDICTMTDADTDTVCETGSAISVSRSTGTGTGEIVYAHTKRLMPMRVGGLITMKKRAAQASSASASASASASVSDDMISDRLYDVVEGSWPLVQLPFPVFTCCTDPITGIETVEMTQCNKAVVEGYWCIGPDIGCASASESV